MTITRDANPLSSRRNGSKGAIRPHVTLLALIASLTVAPFAVSHARAESGAGVDTSLGNALNPAGTSSTKEQDPVRLGIQEFSRSPTGFLVTRPNLPEVFTNNDFGWLRSGSIEVGGLGVGGDWRAAKFREYKVLDRGGYLMGTDLRAGGGQYGLLLGLPDHAERGASRPPIHEPRGWRCGVLWPAGEWRGRLLD